MQNVTRKLIFKQLKQFKCQRKFSISAALKNDEFVIKSSFPDIVIPNSRVFDRLWIHFASYKDRVALECAETKKVYTYTQLRTNIAVFGTSLLKKLGVKSGDVVAVMLPNRPEFPVVAFGSLQAGCVVTTINPAYKEYEVSHQTAQTEPKVFVTVPECYYTAVKGLKEAKINPKIIIVDNPSAPIPAGTIRYTEIAENGEADYKLLDQIERKPDDLAFIPFSSGTTGLPKGVEITHKNVLAAMETMDYEKNRFAILAHGDFQDVLPSILPFYHIYGLIVSLIGHLQYGAKMVTMSKFTPALFFDILKNENVTLLYIVPPMAILLGKHPDMKKEYLRHVRHISCGAAPLSGGDAHAILEKSGRDIEFHHGYGMTETTSLATTVPIGSTDVDHSSCGIPMASVKLRFMDPLSGNPVPVGQQGELLISGLVVTRGYFKNAQATRDSMTEDGFFKTGDLGHYTPGKGLYITDRIKELIKVKGLQVAPAELEGVLRLHPSVQEAAVIGVPHQFNGEVPKAFVLPKTGATPSSKELQDFVSGKVASFKRLEEVVFVKEIPKTSSGKILRRDLKKLYA